MQLEESLSGSWLTLLQWEVHKSHNHFRIHESRRELKKKLLFSADTCVQNIYIFQANSLP